MNTYQTLAENLDKLLQSGLFTNAEYAEGGFLRVVEIVALVAVKVILEEHIDGHVQIRLVSLLSTNLLQPLLFLESLHKLDQQN